MAWDLINLEIMGIKKRESEKVTERNLVSAAKRVNGWCIKIPAIHINGLPDRLLLLPNGVPIFVELKSEGEKPTRLQKSVHRKLRKMGFPVEVIETQAQMKQMFKDYGF